MTIADSSQLAAEILFTSDASIARAYDSASGSRSSGEIGRNAFDDFLRESFLVIEPVTADQVELARSAYRAYGRGSGHPARLNFGDCFAYGLAKATGGPLLFKGDDFTQTDVRIARLPGSPDQA